MKTKTIVTALGVLTLAANASAQSHESTVTRTGPQGKQATITHQAGSPRAREVSVTGTEGNSATRSVQGQGRLRVIEGTGPQGRSYQRQTYRGPFLRGGSVTGPEGTTRHRVRVRR